MDYPCHCYIYIVGLVVGDPNTGLPNHQTVIPSTFSSRIHGFIIYRKKLQTVGKVVNKIMDNADYILNNTF